LTADDDDEEEEGADFDSVLIGIDFVSAGVFIFSSLFELGKFGFLTDCG